MEKAALEAQEVSNFVDPNQIEIDANQHPNFYGVIVAPPPPTLDKVSTKSGYVWQYGAIERRRVY